ncbi:MAG: tetratricopeptide repeat protein, partial [Thermoanaerobaculia bacterium]|nr:tetratricopeptide repeat protein [Thermoanaerobaculia bacterium]
MPPARTLSMLLLAALLAFLLTGPVPGQPTETSPSVQVRVQRALGLLAAGRSDEAEAIFEEVVAEDPSHGTARLQLGRLALERGELDPARRHLEIAVDSDPQRLYLARFLLGRVALAEGDAAAALEAFAGALDSAPGFGPARLGLAEASLLAGRDEAAVDAAMEASRAEVTHRAATLLGGELLAYLGRDEEARALLEPLAAEAEEVGAEGVAARAYLYALDGSAEARRDLRVLLGRNLSRAAIYRAF